VQRVHPSQGGGQAIRSRQPIVVVRVKLEAQRRKLPAHAPHLLLHLRRHQHSERVCQVDAAHAQLRQRLRELHHVPGTLADAARPVLQVDSADLELGAARGREAALDLLAMLRQADPELQPAVTLGALDEQVHTRDAGGAYPVHRTIAIAKTERLDAMQLTCAGGPVGDAFRRAAFTSRNARRAYFHTIHADIAQQHAGDA
jgi:hypothetical protein